MGGTRFGAQLAAPTGREDLLLQVARQIEGERHWTERKPPIFGGEIGSSH